MKKISLLFTILIIYSLNIALAQAPVIAWQNTIGGSGADYLSSIRQTNDEGYILGGWSSSGISGDKTEPLYGNGWADYWVVKLDATGQTIEWQNTIGGNSLSQLFSIQQTSDGGYILGGHSMSGISNDKTEENYGYVDYWVIKLDYAGNIEWQNTIGGNDWDSLESIQQTSDGGYILGGSSMSYISGEKTEACKGWLDYWVIKLNDMGAIDWQKIIGGSDFDVLESIQQTIDGGYILGGYSDSGISGDKIDASKGNFDYWVIKLDGTGNISWQNTIGGGSDDELYSIQQTNDGGYILGGHSFSDISGDKTEASQGGSDYWVVKLEAYTETPFELLQDAQDDIMSQLPTGDNNTDLILQKAIENLDKSLAPNLWVDDSHLTEKGAQQFIFVKTAVHELIKAFEVEGSLGLYIQEAIDNLVSIESTLAQTAIDEAVAADGNIQDIEKANTEMDKAQEELDKENFDKAIEHYKKAWHHADKALKKVILSKSGGMINDKLTDTTIPLEFALQQNYPNPFNPSTTIRYGLGADSHVTVEIYDIVGKLISTLINTEQSQGWHSVIWNGTNQHGELVPVGIYLSKLTSGNEVKTTKLMLLK